MSKFSGIAKGNFVNAFQQIGVISPDSNLIVELLVSPIDIGMVEINMPVKYQIDALNYNRWGFAHGKVKDISRDLVQVDGGEAFFRVKCSLNKTVLELEDIKSELTKGLTLTGQMILTKRSLFNLFYDKVDDWINPKLKYEETSKN